MEQRQHSKNFFRYAILVAGDSNTFSPPRVKALKIHKSLLIEELRQ